MLKRVCDLEYFPSHNWDQILIPTGWRFVTADEKLPGENTIPDPIHPEFTHIREVYFSNDPDYSGRFTVPVLFDKKTKQIVSNEVRTNIKYPHINTNQTNNPQSAEIIRMLYYEFDDLITDQYKKLDLFPANLRSEIEASNEWIYNGVNNGVYKSGFATTQEAYEKNVTTLFASLDKIEAHLSKQSAISPFFFGNTVTEADIRLFTTIVRFDPVYVQHFKCNIRDIRSGYPAIHRWVRGLYWDLPAFGETTDFEHIKKHYTKSHKQINPFAITPVGPVPDILPKDVEVNAVKA